MFKTFKNISKFLHTYIQSVLVRITHKNNVLSRALNLRRLKRIRQDQVPPYTHCQNCGETLNGMYCHCCGQYAIDINESFFKFIKHYLDTSFAYDGKLWGTLKHLFVRPGHLPNEYTKGRVASYMHPFKMYMFCSFIFFFLFFNFTLDNEAVNKALNVNNNTLSIQIEDENQNKISKDKNTKLSESEIKDKIVTEFIPAFKSYAPIGMFVLMPFFAFIQMISFRKKKYGYMNHLIFSINLHTVLMLLFSVDILITLILDNLKVDSLWNASGLYIYITLLYLLIATKRFYGYTWKKSLILITVNILIYFFFVVLFFSSFLILNVLLKQNSIV